MILFFLFKKSKNILFLAGQGGGVRAPLDPSPELEIKYICSLFSVWKVFNDLFLKQFLSPLLSKRMKFSDRNGLKSATASRHLQYFNNWHGPWTLYGHFTEASEVDERRGLLLHQGLFLMTSFLFQQLITVLLLKRACSPFVNKIKWTINCNLELASKRTRE